MARFFRSPGASRLARPWPVFLLQQALIAGSGWSVLVAVRRCTGRTLHGGVDPAGLLDGLVVLVVYGLHFALTVGLYRLSRGAGAPPLGLAWSSRRGREFAVGALVAGALSAGPGLVALAAGRVQVVSTLASHWGEVGVASIAFGLAVLLINSGVEEVASRALPMRLWADRPLWFRALVPSLFFAMIHWVDEPVLPGPFASRTLAGITLSLAYAATGNVWLAAGVHTGMNYGSTVTGGLWHFGALVKLSGEAPVPGWASYLVLALVAVSLRARRRSP